MNPLLRSIPAILALASPSSGQGESLVEAPDWASPVTFTGTVIDEQGEGVAGAWVTLLPDVFTLERMLGAYQAGFVGYESLWGLWDQRERLPRAVTEADGSFQLLGWSVLVRDPRDPIERNTSDSPDCRPRLLVSRSDMATREIWLDRFERGSVNLGTVSVVQGSSIAGRILGEDGQPLAGVMVSPWTQEVAYDYRVGVKAMNLRRLLDEELTRDGPWVSDAVVSDADGRFEITGVWPGLVNLRMDHPGYLSRQRDESVGLGERRELGDIVMLRGHVIAGQVVDQQGLPVPDAEVFVDWWQDYSPIAGEPYAEEIALLNVTIARGCAMQPDARTDVKGRFEVGGLEGDCQRLLVSAAGLEPLLIDNVAGEDSLRIVLPTQAVLDLQVVDAETGVPIDGATCTAERTCNSWGVGVRVAITSSAGTVRVHGLGAHGTTVVVSAPGHARTGFIVQGVRPNTLSERTVALPTESVIEGRVVRSDLSAVAGAEVTISTRIDDGVYDERSVRTDEHGHFAFGEVGVGRVHVSIRPRGCINPRVGDSFDLDGTAKIVLPDFILL